MRRHVNGPRVACMHVRHTQWPIQQGIHTCSSPICMSAALARLPGAGEDRLAAQPACALLQGAAHCATPPGSRADSAGGRR